MRNISLLLAVAMAVIAWRPAAYALEVVKTEDASMNVEGRLQVFGQLERVDDDFRDDNRMFMFLRQARLGVSGDISDVKYKVTLGFAGEDEARAPSPGVSLGLLDMYADVPLKFAGDKTYVRVGQFKAPFGLERLSDSGGLNYADRSIQNLALRIGRDMGVAVHSRLGNVVGTVGMYTGGGRDVPERFLPEVLGVPMFVARVGYDNGLYENAFAEKAAEVGPGVKYAVSGNAVYLKDSQIGHSTVMNVRLGEKSLLINNNWNPYLGQAPMDRGELWQVGGDAAVRIPAGPGAALAEVEVNYGNFANKYGHLGMLAGRTEVGYEYDRFEAGVRYAVVQPDVDMRNSGRSITGGRPYHEVTPGLRIKLPAHTRLILDLPILLQAPVVVEDKIGTYVLPAQPDQASYVKTGGIIEKQNIVAGRMMFQAEF